MRLSSVRALAVAAAALAVGNAAAAQGVITSPGGNYSAGIDSLGNLFVGNPYLGLRRNGDGFDPIRPGTPREAWGVSANGASGWVDPQYIDGPYIQLDTNSYGANTASVAAWLVDPLGNRLLHVSQMYDWAAENVLRICIEVTNVSGAPVSSYFSRNVDWDMPNAFENYSTVDPLSAPIVDAAYYGFESADPLAAFFSSSGPAGGVFGPGDYGGGMLIDLGMLAAGDTSAFTIYHALNLVGQGETGLRNQLYGLGASFVITGTDVSYDDFGDPSKLENSVAALAYGPKVRNVVPEPGTLAMLAGFGVAGFAAVRRRK